MNSGFSSAHGICRDKLGAVMLMCPDSKSLEITDKISKRKWTVWLSFMVLVWSIYEN